MTAMAWGQSFPLRLLNHWDNPDGTVERGYAGRSIWKWDEIPLGEQPMPEHLRTRYEEYGRINQAYRINGTVLNNVNAKPQMLATDMLHKTAKIADILRNYGMRVYLSVNFASPKALGDLPTADPKDERVALWWKKKVDEIYSLIPDFGGFLVKANSEGEPGPMDYGRTHVDGANMLAAALAPHNGVVMWRAFVYSSPDATSQRLSTDRANQAYEEFIHLDGQFADNVIIQIKNGPIDFQPREPVSPLFFALKKTKMMMELQITQEYTGESIHTCFLAPMWREVFDTLKDYNVPLVGVAGVANIGDAPNWTGNSLAMANWYAFGRLADNPNTPSKAIAEDFLKEYYSKDERFVRPVTQLLLKSRETLVNYMMPMGLHHLFAGGHHYGPEPWYAPAGCREDWLPRFYHRADGVGLGFDRTTETGSGNTAQYPGPLRTLYNNRETCPEKLLLWFHHVPWDYKMHNGLSLWDNLCQHYDLGVQEAKEFVKTWESVRSYIDSKCYEEQHWRFVRQAKDAHWWRDACLLYFQTFSHRPLPEGSPAPMFTLQQLKDFHLDMDNYSTADPKKLPDPSLRLPQFFADGMVLQRGERIPVWGWAQPHQTITVALNGKSVSTTVNSDGTWRVELPKMKAGGPYTMTIRDSAEPEEPTILHNILIGDVFLCSGQSNMELPIRRCMDVVEQDVKDYANDNIRYLKLPHQYNCLRPNDDVITLPWQNITPENCGEVSGICYFMARELQEKYHVPIGIINSAVGGTPVQAWMPSATLSQFEDCANELKTPRYHQENWVDSVRACEAKDINAWERRMNREDTIVNRWRKPDCDFSAWQIVDMFSNWSMNRNGSYWFRTTVKLPPSAVGKKALLRFGAMKDADTIYVNRQYVGNTTYEYPPRKYVVPQGLLHEGENEIVVHLMSQNGNASFTQGKSYQLEVEGQIHPIASELQMAVGCTMPPRPSSTYFVSGYAGLYNAMIAPLHDFPLRGVLWYQGESNLCTTSYADMLQAMMESWRMQFRKKHLPLVIMQLPGYMERHQNPVETEWTGVRHQQYLASRQIAHAALVSTLDMGEPNDIHPQDKKTVGHRAALQMARVAYGDTHTVSCGPTPVSATVKNGFAIITFAKDSGRLCVHGDRLRDFAILVDGQYQWAEATIAGSHAIKIALPEGITSTKIRYGWDDFPQPSLYNEDGIPAPQFQIDCQ